MQGYLTRLVPVEDEDYALVAKWLQPGPEGALGAGGESQFMSTKQLGEALGRSTGAMVATMDGRKVGYVQWHRLKHGGSYEVGGMIGDTDLWDSGCGAEAGLLLLDYLFHEKNAHRVQFMTGTYNRRVLNFMMKSNVVVEGVLRDYFFLDGCYHDAVIASLLREEYYAAAKEGVAVRDLVPAEDRERGRAEFQEYMRGRWDTVYTELLERG
ncbi:GNAT family N-acetyltransferase [Actinokineospora sp.]|uniref:GNAT family N-acetyltransferase n=1 Tax=Actinokineospora sp. TaxID=1872133 RepID=UPI00403766AF